jgi:O-antigen ligase
MLLFLDFDFIPQWVLFGIAVSWCAISILFTFSIHDMWLIGLLVAAISAYLLHYAEASVCPNAVAFVTGVAVGKGTRLLFKQSPEWVIDCALVLLVIASGCRLDLTNDSYQGPRWTGLWQNPNTYGMLMGAAFVLSACASARPQPAWSRTLLGAATAMTFIGLLFSFSRGAWCGTVVAGLYLLARQRNRLAFMLAPLIAGLVLVGVLCWKVETHRWYLKRLDLSAGSCQHRLSAWAAATRLILDHPQGVGWNRAGIACKNPAVATNDYLTIGAELGAVPLVCLSCYLGSILTLKINDWTQRACRAAAFVLLVSFWFDGGLFDLAPAALFWMLLELSYEN